MRGPKSSIWGTKTEFKLFYAMVLKTSKGQWMSLSVKVQEGQPCRTTTPLPPTLSCALYEATTVSLLKKNG